MTRLRDRLAAGLTVDVPEGPGSYRAAGWILRLLAILALAGAGFSLIVALLLFPYLIFVGSLAGPGLISSLSIGFVTVLVSGVTIFALALLVLNHLHIGWSARLESALWGTRAVTALAVASSLWTAAATAGSDPVAAISGLGTGTLVLVALHVLTWTEGTREAFREDGAGEGDVDAVLEAGS